MSARNYSRKNNLSGRDLKVFELHMRGFKNREIAVLLNLAEQNVSNCLNIEPIKEARAQVFENTIARLSSGVVTESAMTIARVNAPRMMQLQVQIAESGRSEAVRLQAINNILDRSLGKPMQRVVIDKMDEILENMSDSEIETYSKDGILPARFEEMNARGGGTVH